MPNINPLTALRSLKGAPLSCLVALMFASQPVGKEWLSRITGYSDKPVSAALDYLLEMGFVTSSGRYHAWQINHQAIQLPLETTQMLSESSRNYSDSNPTTTALIVESNNQKLKAVAAIQRSRNFSDSHELLQSAKVGEPMATILAESDHTSPYYVAAHILKAREDNISTSLLIHRMREKDPAPDLNQNYHLMGCDCLDCDHFRFSPDKGLLEPSDFDTKCFY